MMNKKIIAVLSVVLVVGVFWIASAVNLTPQERLGKKLFLTQISQLLLASLVRFAMARMWDGRDLMRTSMKRGQSMKVPCWGASATASRLHPPTLAIALFCTMMEPSGWRYVLGW